MNFKKIYQIIALLFFVSSTLTGQPLQLNFKYLTSNEGLTQGVINDVFTDSKGFVWMTSPDGITRFDGTRCLANNEIAPGLLNITYTQGIMEDSDGDIWIGYSEGLVRFDYHLNHFECTKLNLPPTVRLHQRQKSFVPLAAGDANNLVVYVSNNLALLYSPDEKKITLLPTPATTNISISSLFLKEKNGKIIDNLYCTNAVKKKLTIYRFAGFENKQPRWESIASTGWEASDLQYSAIQNDSTVIVCSRGLIAKYHFNTGLFEKKSFPLIITPFLSVDMQQNIWVGTNIEGLYALDGQSLDVKAHYTYEPGNIYGISSNWSVPYCDRLGNLWLLSWGKGVDYCNISDIKFASSFTEKQSQIYHASSFIRDIVKDDKGNFYCSSQAGGIVLLDKQLQYVQHLRGVSTTLTCPDMFLKGHYLYFGVDMYQKEVGFYKYDLSTGNIKEIQHNQTHKDDLELNRVYQLALKNDGNLLAATYGGLWEFNTQTDTYESLPGITETFEVVVFSHQDRHGYIYKGVNGNGLEIYQPTAGRFKKVFSLDKKNTIKHCVEINDSLMWMGSTDGLYLFNTLSLQVIKHFSTANGLPNNVVYAIMPDEKGNLWLSTNKGLSYFYVVDELFKNFTVEDGLQSNEFNTHAVVKASDGRIIFGGVNGLTTVNEAMLYKKSPAPIIHITGVKADSAMNPFAFDGQSKLLLCAGSNTIEFQLTVIDFINPSKCKIEYRLRDYVDEWTQVSNPAIARFVKLPAGHYILEYRASNAEGQWSNEIKSFPFTIAAYWWQTGWFKIVIILVAVAVFFVSVRLYVRSRLHRQKTILEKAQAIQTERERIIADLHDDIGATISSMHIYGDLAENVWHTKPETSKEMVGKITHQAKDLMIRMGDIIWSMKPAGEEKYSFTARLKNYANELLSPKNIVCEFNIDEAISKQISHPEVRKNILLIAKEAMNNIAKYSEASKATVSLLKHNERVVLTIRDNGKGYNISPFISSTQKTHNGNGVQNIQERCKQLNGILNIESFDGLGVMIECNFPMTIISHSL